jgi:CDGSH iron-sulfur domain-containing protein 3
MSEAPMTEPKIVDTKPTVMTLDPGKYFWCSCGLSENQPFCNGSHKGTGFTPIGFEVSDAKPVALCLCKNTQNSPFCDGSHAKLKLE